MEQYHLRTINLWIKTLGWLRFTYLFGRTDPDTCGQVSQRLPGPGAAVQVRHLRSQLGRRQDHAHGAGHGVPLRAPRSRGGPQPDARPDCQPARQPRRLWGTARGWVLARGGGRRLRSDLPRGQGRAPGQGEAQAGAAQRDREQAGGIAHAQRTLFWAVSVSWAGRGVLVSWAGRPLCSPLPPQVQRLELELGESEPGTELAGDLNFELGAAKEAVRRPLRPFWRPFWLGFTYVTSVRAKKY
jgi:hypothetical protein